MLSSCSTPSNQDEVRNGACFGDYINLDINLELNHEQARPAPRGPVLSAGPAAPACCRRLSPAPKPRVQQLPELPDLLGG